MGNSKLDAHLRTLFLIVCVALGIFREPALENALFLKEHFMDAPEAGEGKAADDGGEDGIEPFHHLGYGISRLVQIVYSAMTDA